MTNELASRLAEELTPVSRGSLRRRLAIGLLASAVLAGIAMLAWLGLRPGLTEAMGTMIFWYKLAFTAVFAGLGFWAATRLSRPGGSLRRPAMAMFGLIVLAGLFGIIQLLVMGPEHGRELTMGSSALLCPFYIAALAIPIYAATVMVMRRLAPTNLTGAGLAAGLLAGGAAAWVYAFHCTESGMPFVALWYTTGILIAAAIGALLGRWLLRW